MMQIHQFVWIAGIGPAAWPGSRLRLIAVIPSLSSLVILSAAKDLIYPFEQYRPAQGRL